MSYFFFKFSGLLFVLAVTFESSHAQVTAIGNVCTISTQCSSVIPHSECATLACACSSGYSGTTGDTACTVDTLSVCDTATSDTCTLASDFCDLAADAGATLGQCRRLVTEDCLAVGDCGVASTVCVDNNGGYKCYCDANYAVNANNICKLDLDQATCMTPGDCADANAVCTASNCKCATDFQNVNGICDKVAVREVCDSAQGSVCADAEATCTTVDTEDLCICNSGFMNVGGVCSKVKVHENCYPDITSVCEDANAACREDGSLGGANTRYRCLCNSGYIAVESTTTPGEYECKEMLSSAIVPACVTCEQNSGTCYETGAAVKGCQCPATRSGATCAVLHVSLTCNFPNMKICYLPQTGVDLTAASRFYIADHGHQASCGSVVDASCGSASHYSISLSLKPSDLDTCGTNQFRTAEKQLMYENSVVILKDGALGVTEDNSFNYNVYCSFFHTWHGGFMGVGVAGPAGTGEGVEVIPNVQFRALTMEGEPISEGISLRLGDDFMLEVELDTTGSVYGSIRVENCLASSSGMANDMTADNVMLLEGSCPSAGQNYIEGGLTSNNFAHYQNLMNVMRTGAIAMFKMSQGNVVYIRCSVKVCLDGVEEPCEPEACLAGKRKKRSARDVYTDKVEFSLKWHDDATPGGGLVPTDSGDEKDGGMCKNKIFLYLSLAVLLPLLLILLLVITWMCTRARRDKVQGEREKKVYFTEPPNEFRWARSDLHDVKI